MCVWLCVESTSVIIRASFPATPHCDGNIRRCECGPGGFECVCVCVCFWLDSAPLKWAETPGDAGTFLLSLRIELLWDGSSSSHRVVSLSEGKHINLGCRAALQNTDVSYSERVRAISLPFKPLLFPKM